jgi:adhesin transport system membrane fusion protein
MKTKRASYLSHILIWTIVVFFISVIVWANYAILDEVTTGTGRVIPSSQIQVIQNLEGGIVKKILVHEGEVVQKNQVLMQIANVRFKATLDETQGKIIALELKILRLNAERKNKQFIVPKKYSQMNPLLVAEEKALHLARQNELKQMKDSYSLVIKELNLTRPLVDKGAVSTVEVLKLERTANTIQGEIYKFKSKALEQLNTARADLNNLKSTHPADLDRLDRTTVRSPVKGIIKQIKINTVGGVIKPGMDIIEIVPLNDTLLIEAKIKPSDIGFIRPQQKAVVKITAYDFAIYSGLDGVIEQISADTISESINGKEETYYLVRVRTQKNYLGTKEKPLYIIPGMMATVDILTGEKSVLDYILKPILRAKNNALRER